MLGPDDMDPLLAEMEGVFKRLRDDPKNAPAPVYGKDYFDTPPLNAITAEQVREWHLRAHHDRTSITGLYEKVMRCLLTHPGVSSAARAVIEAALE